MADENKRGGPNTPEGREKSSWNSTTHGLRAKKVRLLGDETQDQYDAVVEGWSKQFEPADYQEEKLVETLIFNDWMHQRAQRWLLEGEASMVERFGVDPLHWPGEQRHSLELVQRYKTTAERAFYRSWSALQGLRKDIMRENDKNLDMRFELERLKMQKERHGWKDLPEKPAEEAKAVAPALTRAQQVFGGQKSKKKQKKIVILDQWVEIEILPNGKTFTALSPSNEILIQDGQKKWPPPEMVYRRMHFVNGVPPEYYWTTSNESIRKTGGMGIQRMTTDTWLELIEKEKELGTGHLLPCGGNLPRPEERGGCDCQTCSQNRAILEARAA